MLLTIYAYLALTIFLGVSAYKAWWYAKMPLHGRMELYPVPKEAGRQEYGGSYYEEVEWWRKPHKISHFHELKSMLEEMIFIKKLFDNQRKMWWMSYGFHLGIYGLASWTVLLTILAVIKLNGMAISSVNFFVEIIKILMSITGVAGWSLATLGSAALFFRRLADSSLRRYTTPQDYLNLICIVAVLFTGILAWGSDPVFNRPLQAMEQVVSLQPLVLGRIATIHVVLLGLLLIYIPLSSMSHYVGKYFSFHKVLWDNEPNLPGSTTAKALERTATVQPRTVWSAPHIQPGGRLRDGEIASVDNRRK